MVVMIIYDDRPICNSALKGFVMAISTYTIHATRQMLTASRGDPDRNFNCSINHLIS